MRYIYLFVLIWLALSMNSYAEKMVYVSDSFWITLRTGPGSEYRIIALLPSGEPLQVISSKGDWTKVKPLNPKYKSEGWVLSRFIMKRKPYKDIVKKLSKENSELKNKVSELGAQLKEKASNEKNLKENLENITQLYQQIKNKYETLKKDSADYLGLKNKYEKKVKELYKAKKEIKKLRQENGYLKRSQLHRWFLMGAFVLFAGIILGLILSRQRKRSMYY